MPTWARILAVGLVVWFMCTGSMCETTAQVPPPPPAAGCPPVVPYDAAADAALLAQERALEAQNSDFDSSPVAKALVEYADMRAAARACAAAK